MRQLVAAFSCPLEATQEKSADKSAHSTPAAHTPLDLAVEARSKLGSIIGELLDPQNENGLLFLPGC